MKHLKHKKNIWELKKDYNVVRVDFLIPDNTRCDDYYIYQCVDCVQVLLKYSSKKQQRNQTMLYQLV